MPDDGGRRGIAQLGLVGLCTNTLSRRLSSMVTLLEVLLCKRLLHLPGLLGMSRLSRRMLHTWIVWNVLSDIPINPASQVCGTTLD
jgi:hypothetical protein